MPQLWHPPFTPPCRAGRLPASAKKTQGAGMNIVERAKRIIISPKTEWDVIEGESTPTQQLLVGYVLPLSAVAAIASFIGSALFAGMIGGMFGARVGIGGALLGAVIAVIMAVVSVFVIGFIVDALAPTFGGQKNM